MSPITKAHSLAFAIATTCVYAVWNKLTVIQTDWWIDPRNRIFPVCVSLKTAPFDTTEGTI